MLFVLLLVMHLCGVLSMRTLTTAKASSTFLWLVQTENKMPEFFRHIAHRNDTDVLIVTFRDPFPPGAWLGFDTDRTYFPNSTWTQGRNRLYQLGLELETRPRADGSLRNFSYFVFADDDVHLQIRKKGGVVDSNVDTVVDMFHRWLRADRPTIGIGSYFAPFEAVRGTTAVRHFDAIMNAFSRPVLPYLLPYEESLDSISVYLSQAVLVWMCNALLTGQTHRMGPLLVRNGQHREYERGYESGGDPMNPVPKPAFKAAGGFFGWRTREAIMKRVVDYSLEQCLIANRPSFKPFWTKCRPMNLPHGPYLDECHDIEATEEPSFCHTPSDLDDGQRDFFGRKLKS